MSLFDFWFLIILFTWFGLSYLWGIKIIENVQAMEEDKR